MKKKPKKKVMEKVKIKRIKKTKKKISTKEKILTGFGVASALGGMAAQVKPVQPKTVISATNNGRESKLKKLAEKLLADTFLPKQAKAVAPPFGPGAPTNEPVPQGYQDYLNYQNDINARMFGTFNYYSGGGVGGAAAGVNGNNGGLLTNPNGSGGQWAGTAPLNSGMTDASGQNMFQVLQTAASTPVATSAYNSTENGPAQFKDANGNVYTEIGNGQVMDSSGMVFNLSYNNVDGKPYLTATGLNITQTVVSGSGNFNSDLAWGNLNSQINNAPPPPQLPPAPPAESVLPTISAPTAVSTGNAALPTEDIENDPNLSVGSSKGITVGATDPGIQAPSEVENLPAPTFPSTLPDFITPEVPLSQLPTQPPPVDFPEQGISESGNSWSVVSDIPGGIPQQALNESQQGMWEAIKIQPEQTPTPPPVFVDPYSNVTFPQNKYLETFDDLDPAFSTYEIPPAASQEPAGAPKSFTPPPEPERVIEQTPILNAPPTDGLLAPQPPVTPPLSFLNEIPQINESGDFVVTKNDSPTNFIGPTVSMLGATDGPATTYASPIPDKLTLNITLPNGQVATTQDGQTYTAINQQTGNTMTFYYEPGQELKWINEGRLKDLAASPVAIAGSPLILASSIPGIIDKGDGTFEYMGQKYVQVDLGNGSSQYMLANAPDTLRYTLGQAAPVLRAENSNYPPSFTFKNGDGSIDLMKVTAKTGILNTGVRFGIDAVATIFTGGIGGGVTEKTGVSKKLANFATGQGDKDNLARWDYMVYLATDSSIPDSQRVSWVDPETKTPVTATMGDVRNGISLMQYYGFIDGNIQSGPNFTYVPFDGSTSQTSNNFVQGAEQKFESVKESVSKGLDKTYDKTKEGLKKINPFKRGGLDASDPAVRQTLLEQGIGYDEATDTYYPLTTTAINNGSFQTWNDADGNTYVSSPQQDGSSSGLYRAINASSGLFQDLITGAIGHMADDGTFEEVGNNDVGTGFQFTPLSGSLAPDAGLAGATGTLGKVVGATNEQNNPLENPSFAILAKNFELKEVGTGAVSKYVFVDPLGKIVTDPAIIAKVASSQLHTENEDKILSQPGNEQLADLLSDGQVHPNFNPSSGEAPQFIGKEAAVNEILHSYDIQLGKKQVSVSGVAIPETGLQYWVDSVNDNGILPGGQAFFDFMTSPIPVTDKEGNPTGDFKQLAYVTGYNENGQPTVVLNSGLYSESENYLKSQGSIMLASPSTGTVAHEFAHVQDFASEQQALKTYNSLDQNTKAFFMGVLQGDKIYDLSNTRSVITETNARLQEPYFQAMVTALKEAPESQKGEVLTTMIKNFTGLDATYLAHNNGIKELVLEPATFSSDLYTQIFFPKDATKDPIYYTSTPEYIEVKDNKGFIYTIASAPNGKVYVASVKSDTGMQLLGKNGSAYLTVPGVGELVVNRDAALDSNRQKVNLTVDQLSTYLKSATELEVDVIDPVTIQQQSLQINNQNGMTIVNKDGKNYIAAPAINHPENVPQEPLYFVENLTDTKNNFLDLVDQNGNKTGTVMHWSDNRMDISIIDSKGNGINLDSTGRVTVTGNVQNQDVLANFLKGVQKQFGVSSSAADFKVEILGNGGN